MKRKFRKLVLLVLVLCMFHTSAVFAEEADAIRNMSYEEWLEEQAGLGEQSGGETDLDPVIIQTQKEEVQPIQAQEAVIDENVRTGNKSLNDILAEKGTYEFDGEINLDQAVGNVISGIADDAVMERTAPVSDLRIFIYNPESLIGDQLTTDTILVALFDDSDEDGDTIVERYVDGNAVEYIAGVTEDGFVMQFTEPGSYMLFYQTEDSAGEFSRMMRYAFNVIEAEVPVVEKYQVFEGSFSSANDSVTYNFSLDFTDINSAAVCLVRKGYVGAKIKVYDEGGNELFMKGTGERQAKNWGFIDKPSSDAGVCNYTVVVSPNGYQTRASDYRIIIGDKKDTELMMSGIENTVLLDQYYEAKVNLQNSAYVPNVGEYWFKYRRESTSVITILSNVDDLRFKVLEADTLDEGFNSASNSATHRTSFLGGSSGVSSWKAAEKARLNTVVGDEYYLVVYSTRPMEGLSLKTGSMATAVGHPVMTGDRVTISPERSVTINSSDYSSSINFSIDRDDLPNSGQVREVAISNFRLSYMDRWRVSAPNYSSWNTSPALSFTIDMNHRVDSDNNARLKGNWSAAVMANSSGNKQIITPEFTFYYNYEYGDYDLL